jgi:hypothetical protein
LYKLDDGLKETYVINVTTPISAHLDEIIDILRANPVNELSVYWITMSSQNSDKLKIERAMKQHKKLIDLDLPIGYINVLNDTIFGSHASGNGITIPEQTYEASLDAFYEENNNNNKEKLNAVD